jgi:hypothetical protein
MTAPLYTYVLIVSGVNNFYLEVIIQKSFVLNWVSFKVDGYFIV